MLDIMLTFRVFTHQEASWCLYLCQQSVAAALSASPVAAVNLTNFGRLASLVLIFTKALTNQLQCLTEMQKESLVILVSSL